MADQHRIRFHENDILMGRGGDNDCSALKLPVYFISSQIATFRSPPIGHNHRHSGNEQLRNIARDRVNDYRRATKKQKAVISRYVINKQRLIISIYPRVEDEMTYRC